MIQLIIVVKNKKKRNKYIILGKLSANVLTAIFSSRAMNYSVIDTGRPSYINKSFASKYGVFRDR